ncbi:MAG: copper chaperone PCu(A)C [Hyphomicrobium sp.]
MLFLTATAFSALADAPVLEISKAWAPAADKSTDLPVYMAITNAGESDDIVRVQCPTVAHFSEKRATDHGEGAPSTREVKSVPIKDHGTTVLEPGGYHLALLKIIGPVKEGDTFDCQIAFRRAGRIGVQVTVTKAEPK